MSDQGVRESVETTALPDGRVLCPLPNCGKFIGSVTPDRSQFYCRHCKVEITVRNPSFDVRFNGAGLAANVSNPNKRQLLAMILAIGVQDIANRARALELIAHLPDDHEGHSEL